MRLLTILAAYVASSLAAMVVLVVFGWIDAASLGLDRIGYLAPLFVGGAASGALYALPVAVPMILFTEWTRKTSPLMFALAGLATAAVMLAALGTYTLIEIARMEPYAVRDVIVVSAVCTAASLTYWLFAWKLFPPAPVASKVNA